MAGDKRWLILSYFSRIDGMACAQHIDDRIPYLQQQGIEPIMLTGVCGDDWEGLLHAKALSVAPSGVRFELRHMKKRGKISRLWFVLLNVLILPLYLLEKLLIDLDSQWSWFPLATVNGRKLCETHRPDVIYSTGGPASAHLAAAFLASRYNIPWVAEFQDPLVHDDWLRSRRALKVFQWLERLICQRADAVIFLTDQARRNADARTGMGGRGQVLYPGAQPQSLTGMSRQSGEYCRFAHFGSLGGSRNLKVFLEGLVLVLQQRPELVESLRLDLYGTCDRFSRQAIDAFPWNGVIHDHGRISRSASIDAMQRCSVLLLIQNTEAFSAETIPSKTYEYFQMGRPVLGLVHHNPELRQMLEELGHHAVDADQPDQVASAILDCYERWCNGEKRHQTVTSPYTVEAAVMRLISIARQSTISFQRGQHA